MPNMPPKYAICKKNITTIKFPGLSCYHCKLYFHGSCIGLTNDVLASLLSSDADWSCTTCKPKTNGRRSIIIPPGVPGKSPNSSRNGTASVNKPVSRKSGIPIRNSTSTPHDNQNPLEMSGSMADINKLSLDMASMKSTVSTFQQSMEFFSNKFDDFKIQLDNMESLLARVTELERNNASLQEDVEMLTDKVNKLEEDSFAKDLVLCGIPVLESDELSTKDLVSAFLDEFNLCDIAPHHIKHAKRIVPKTTRANDSNTSRNIPPKILVKFHSSQQKEIVKNAVRSSKRDFPTMSFLNRNINYYAADYLTPSNNKLFYAAKDFARENNYSRVWVSNCNIMLKKTSSSPPIVVRSLSDISKLNFNNQN